jgi:hypothetical protein
MPELAKNIITSFLRRLTNLSGTNRSLVLLKLVNDQFIDVHDFNLINNQSSFEIIKSLVKNVSFKLCALHDSRFEANNVVSQKVKMLQRVDRFVFEEKGTNDLHVGWPFVRGKFNDGTIVRCPLLYFPVSLVQQGANWVLEPRTDAGITLNKSFILAYAFYHQVKVDEELLDFSFEDFDKDMQGFRNQLYQLLQNRIELNFNPDNFADQLIPFTEFKKSDFEQKYALGQLKLFPEAVLGIFPQAGSQLVPDYLHLLENENFEDLEDFFEKQKFIEDDDAPLPQALKVSPVIREEMLYTPFSIDAYQEKAIHLIKTGNSIVVQGPPGTGKSQLICNLLADSMASGKRVLLVCQKRAALDVVYERLQKVDLSPFTALVHDFRNDRREIFDKIADQIERVEEYKTRNRDMDVIQAERRFTLVARNIDQLTEELQDFKNALFDEKECGVSVKTLYLTSDTKAPFLNLKQEYHHFKFPLDGFAKMLNRYSQYAALYEKADYSWKERRSFAEFAASDEQQVEATIKDIVAYQKEISTSVFRLIGVQLNLEDCESFWYRHEEVLGILSLLKEEETFRYFQKMCREPEEDPSLLWLSNMERVTMNCFDEVGPEVTIPTDKLGKFQEALNERMRTRGNLIQMIKWEFFSENKFVVKRALVANDLAYNKFGLRVLEQRIDTRLNLEHHLTALRNAEWLMELPFDYKKENLQRWFNSQKLAVRATAIFHSLREIKNAVNPAAMTRAEFNSVMRHLLDLVKEIPSRKEEWQKYLSDFHIRQLILDPSAAEPLVTTLKKDFDNLCEYDRLKQNISTVEENVIRKGFEHLQQWDGEKLQQLIVNSIKLAWIDHVELKYPILRAVSSMKMDQMQKELHDLVIEKEALSLQLLHIRSREKAYEGLTYNRLNNLVTYRDLQHQVTKKKKVWPLRKLISTFHEELFQLIPVWMASPESVSAIFPMAPLFDLVIFDEASQCFAERGIPAMYRGRQILVAGDGQQLRPSELYQVRWTEEDTDVPDAEVESLLELAERYLPTVHLQGHYRSKSLELIEFSNQHFYDQRLRLLPDRYLLNTHEPAIEYIKVNGVWENQTNEVEARSVIEKVSDLLQEAPHKEIGIVTFNAPQQNLILDLLDEAVEKGTLTLPPTFFVKNIENVQGDEKDIIIFSVGYAPDKKGKLGMLFGSLSMAGGENRLNVAVTRARERVVVITSILPHELNTENSKNQGPRLLQQYLQFAKNVSDRRFSPGVRDKGLGLDSNLHSRIARWGHQRLPSFSFRERVLPYGDVNIMEDKNHLGVVLTDDDRFNQSVSVKDAFAYTPALLKKKNWSYHFVYSRQVWRDIEQLEEKLMLFIGKEHSNHQNG